MMMPYVQGDPDSVPEEYHRYEEIVESLYLKKGDLGFLTIDESTVEEGVPHRGQRAKYGRALHTEAGINPADGLPQWGSGGTNWGGSRKVTLDRDVRILIGSNLDGSCAVWDAEHQDTSVDGDIGDRAHLYPYSKAKVLKCGEIAEIGIFTPHESLPATRTFRRQFIRIVSSGVHGREEYFTRNPLVSL